MIHNGRINLILAAARIRIRRRIDGVQSTVQYHARGGHNSCPGVSISQVWVVDFEPHLFVQRADHEFANRHCFALRKEWPHAKIGVNALHIRRVHCAGGRGGNRPIIDPLTEQGQGH